jgi:hypothetical protein
MDKQFVSYKSEKKLKLGDPDAISLKELVEGIGESNAVEITRIAFSFGAETEVRYK